MRIRIYNFADYLFILSIITIAFNDLGGILPLYLSQIFVILLFFYEIIKNLKLKQLYIAKFIIFSFSYTFLVTFILNNNINLDSIKNYIGVYIYIISFFYYVKDVIKNKDKILHLCFNLSFMVGFLGLIQEVGFMLSVEKLYKYSFIYLNNIIGVSGNFIRITSITTEPAHLAILLIPGMYIALLRIFKIYINKNIKLWKCYSILLATLMTFSLVAYIIAAIIILFILFFDNKSLFKKLVIVISVLICVCLFITIMPSSLKIVSEKINSLFTLNKLTTSNLSSFAIVSNFRIVIESIKDGNFFGIGLGMHQLVYFKYIYKIYDPTKVVMLLNSVDAGSLYLRILSELGIPGFIIIYSFLFKQLILNKKAKEADDVTVILNHLALIFIFTYSIRMASYMDPLFAFMVSLLYFTNKYLNNKANKIAKYKSNDNM